MKKNGDQIGNVGKARFNALDSLRGIAALIVIFPHATGFFAQLNEASWSRLFWTKVAEWGSAGVDIFFVLSGFVIALTATRTKMSFSEVPRFILRRGVRLAPPYWASIVLILAVFALQTSIGRRSQSFPSLAKIAANLFYLQGLTGVGHLNLVYWTLCLEIQFYLFFAIGIAFVHLLARRLPWRDLSFGVLGLSCSCLVSLILFLRSSTPPFLQTIFVFQWYEFSLGIFAWLILSEKGGRYLFLALGFAGIAAVSGALISKWNATVAACTFFLIFYWGYRSRLGVTPFGPVPQYLGKISYSFYLIHVPIIFLWLAVRDRIAVHSPFVSWFLFLIMLLSTIGTANLLYSWVECPAMRLSHRIKIMPKRDNGPG